MTIGTIKLVYIYYLTYLFLTIYLSSDGKSSGVMVRTELFKF